MMFLSKKGAAFIRAHEGFRAKAYRDPVGVLTIGIGFTWLSTSFRQWWRTWKTGVLEQSSTMTKAEADDALQFLVAKEYGKAVNDFLGKEVPQHVFDAMVSAVYNLGPRALQWKWAAAAKQGNYKEAARLLRRTGTTAKGKTLAGLVRRRKEEAHLLETGVYTGVKGIDNNDPPPKPIEKPTQPAQEKEEAPSKPETRGGLFSVFLAFLKAILRGGK